MTPEEFIKWLDKQISDSEKHMSDQDYDLEAVEYAKGHRDAYQIVKKKFLTLTPPTTPNNE